MPIAIIIAAFFSFIIAVGVSNLPQTKVSVSPTPTVKITSTSEQKSSPTVTGTIAPSGTKLSPTKTVPITGTRTPTSTPIYKTPSPTPLVLATSTPKSTPSDTSAPTLDYMTGPADGSTVTFNSFCFPMKFSDTTSPITVRYAMDASSPTDWNQNYAPCYQSVSNGSHTFMVQAKDGVGNISELVKRNFIVDVENPTNQITQSPTPTNTPSP